MIPRSPRPLPVAAALAVAIALTGCGDCGVWEPCHGGALHLYRDTTSEPLRCIYKMVSHP